VTGKRNALREIAHTGQ